MCILFTYELTSYEKKEILVAGLCHGLNKRNTFLDFVDCRLSPLFGALFFQKHISKRSISLLIQPLTKQRTRVKWLTATYVCILNE